MVTDIVEGFRVFYVFIQSVGDRDEPVRIDCLRSPDMKKAVFVVDILPDQARSFRRSATCFQHDDKQDKRPITFIYRIKVFSFVVGYRTTTSLLERRKRQALRRVV